MSDNAPKNDRRVLVRCQNGQEIIADAYDFSVRAGFLRVVSAEGAALGIYAPGSWQYAIVTHFVEAA